MDSITLDWKCNGYQVSEMMCNLITYNLYSRAACCNCPDQFKLIKIIHYL